MTPREEAEQLRKTRLEKSNKGLVDYIRMKLIDAYYFKTKFPLYIKAYWGKFGFTDQCLYINKLDIVEYPVDIKLLRNTFPDFSFSFKTTRWLGIFDQTYLVIEENND